MSGLWSAGFGLSTRAGGDDDEGSTGWGGLQRKRAERIGDLVGHLRSQSEKENR